MDVCRQIGKTPIRVKDVTGFAVNRLLHAMWIEANRFVEEGVATVEDIDIACRLGLGHPNLGRKAGFAMNPNAVSAHYHR